MPQNNLLYFYERGQDDYVIREAHASGTIALISLKLIYRNKRISQLVLMLLLILRVISVHPKIPFLDIIESADSLQRAAYDLSFELPFLG